MKEGPVRAKRPTAASQLVKKREGKEEKMERVKGEGKRYKNFTESKRSFENGI